MKEIFESTNISSIKLNNRIIRSATHEGLADEFGSPDKSLIKLYQSLARGGAGCIITGYTVVDKNGMSSSPGALRIDSDERIVDFQKLTEAVHRENCSVVMQLVHCGRHTRVENSGGQKFAPSPIRSKFYNDVKPLELDEKGIEGIINSFVDSILRAYKSGFDGVQLHIAHGYLLSEFLSRSSNKRLDRWGGSLKNRFRIVEEIYKRASRLLPTFPILAKINGFDNQKNGMSIDEAIEVCKLLESVGCAAIEVSSGSVEDGLFTVRSENLPVDAILKYNKNFKNLPVLVKMILKKVMKYLIKQPKSFSKYNLDSAVKIKEAVSIPLITVGGIKSYTDIDEIINIKGMDFVSMSRPFIREVNIVNKLKADRSRVSKCNSCNICIIASESQPLKCYNGRV